MKHKNNFLLLSALKGFNPKSATFRQHYYPEGGWGWIICVCAVIVEIFTSGIQLSFGVLYVHILRKFGNNNIMPTGNYCSCLQSKVILYCTFTICVKTPNQVLLFYASFNFHFRKVSLLTCHCFSAWIGVVCLSLSYGITPFLVAFCR